MGLKFEQVDRFRSRADVIKNTSENRAKVFYKVRIRAFRRVLLNILSLCGIAFTLHCIHLYMSAFVDIGEITGNTRSIKAKKAKALVSKMPNSKEHTLISPLTNYLAVDRLYMRRGQSVLVTYSLPRRTSLNLTVKQCKTLPVIEIFKCKFAGEQSQFTNNKTNGFIEFVAPRPGFYHFNHTIIQPKDKKIELHYDYRIIWQRNIMMTK